MTLRRFIRTLLRLTIWLSASYLRGFSDAFWIAMVQRPQRASKLTLLVLKVLRYVVDRMLVWHLSCFIQSQAWVLHEGGPTLWCFKPQVARGLSELRSVAVFPVGAAAHGAAPVPVSPHLGCGASQGLAGGCSGT